MDGKNGTNFSSNQHHFPRLPPKCTELLNTEITSGPNGTALIIVYIFSMVFIVVSNSMFVFGLWRTINTKNLFSSQIIFLVISFSDLLAGLVFVPIQLYFIVHIPDVSCNLSITRAFWSTFPITLSGCLIMFLTIDRYSVVSRTRLNRANNDAKLVILYIILSLMASLGWASWHTGITSTVQRDMMVINQRTALFFISIATFELVVLGVSLVFNVLILRAVKRNNEQSSVSDTIKRASEQKLSKTITIIGTSLILTYIPSVVATYIIGITLQQMERSELLGKRSLVIQITGALLWALILTLFNSGLNAAIFIWRNSRIRRLFISMYNHKVGRRQQMDVQCSLSNSVSVGTLSNAEQIPRTQEQQCDSKI